MTLHIYNQQQQKLCLCGCGLPTKSENRYIHFHYMRSRDRKGKNNGMYGKRHTDQTKKKISQAVINKRRRLLVYQRICLQCQGARTHIDKQKQSPQWYRCGNNGFICSRCYSTNYRKKKKISELGLKKIEGYVQI